MGVWADPDTNAKRVSYLAFEDREQRRTRSESKPKRGNDCHERKAFTKSRKASVSSGATSDSATSGDRTSSALAEERA